eukprot:scaffold170436_cov18-Tisochrysis_lutea.AAC.1
MRVRKPSAIMLGLMGVSEEGVGSEAQGNNKGVLGAGQQQQQHQQPKVRKSRPSQQHGSQQCSQPSRKRARPTQQNNGQQQQQPAAKRARPLQQQQQQQHSSAAVGNPSQQPEQVPGSGMVGPLLQQQQQQHSEAAAMMAMLSSLLQLQPLDKQRQQHPFFQLLPLTPWAGPHPCSLHSYASPPHSHASHAAPSHCHPSHACPPQCPTQRPATPPVFPLPHIAPAAPSHHTGPCHTVPCYASLQPAATQCPPQRSQHTQTPACFLSEQLPQHEVHASGPQHCTQTVDPAGQCHHGQDYSRQPQHPQHLPSWSGLQPPAAAPPAPDASV